jgi:ABC-2 type transport system permease protein
VGAALVIAAKDLRQRFRDRSAIVLGFVAPVAIAALMSFAFSTTENFHFTMGVVDDDGGPVAAALLEVLGTPELQEIVTVEMISSPSDARELVNGGDVATAIVIPAGFSEAATAIQPEAGTELAVLTNVDSELDAQVTRALIDSFVAQVNANRLSVATAIAAGAPISDIEALAAEAAAERLPVQVEQQPVGAEQLSTISYYAPGMGIFFVLFAISFAARSFFGERQQGTLERMAVAPVPRRAILAGKALSVFVYAVASLAMMAVVTGLGFGADWGHPLAAAAIIVAIAASVVALTALVIAIARTDRQADGLSSIAVFTLALLGGNFIFISEAPPAMRTLALATPNGWALRAFTDLATTSGGLTHDLGLIVGPLVGIGVFTGVAAGLAAALSRRVALR